MDKERTAENSKTAKTVSYNRIENLLGSTGKLTPQAIEFEEAVLGGLMIDSETVSTILGTINFQMFYKEAHQHIFQAIEQLYRAEQPVDLLTVTNQLRKDKMLDVVGGPAYLASLTNKISSSANIEYHARIVMEKYVLRELIKNCSAIIEDAYDESQDVLDLLDKSETRIFSIIEQNFKRDSKPLYQVVQSTLKELTELRNADSDMHGVPSGIRTIDQKTGGWQKTDLIILAARPGMGKTSFVLSVARNAAIQYEKPVAFFSLEMSSQQLAQRLFSLESGINAEKIAKGDLTEDEWVRLMEKIGKLETSNLIIDDTPAISIFDLRAKCRRLKHQYDIQMIVVDYLQLMTVGGDSTKSGNREQEISYISRSLKALAKDLNVPVIALSQLSRQTENRATSKRPQLSDLRESGAIEQDADMVLFIYRPEYYKLEVFEDNTPSQGVAEIIFEKNRHGSTGALRVRFQSQYTKFSDLDEGYFDESETAPNPAAAMAAMTAMMPGIPHNMNFETQDSAINGDDNSSASNPENPDTPPSNFSEEYPF
ncbi:MAG: replicative DNA helicase [Bacteroidales bacterium]|nr:replicative DNA helicase [Bacteroidales bacterium]